MGRRTDILDEIRRDQGRINTTCGFCEWLREQPIEEREQWHEALVSGFTLASIYRAILRRAPKDANGRPVRPFGESSLINHRRKTHPMPV